jgi:DNA-binding response OmpR family regulator
VLIGIEDETLADRIQQAAQIDGLEWIRANSAEDILSIAGSKDLSLIILDDGQADMRILETCKAIRAFDHASNLPLIVVAPKEFDTGSESCVTDWLVQPFTPEYARTRIHAWVMRSSCRWKRAPLAVDEALRMNRLNELNLLDSKMEERFDRITRIAATAFDVPIALLSLIDKNRQWFKSRIGLEISETPRDRAFCAHTILGEDLMIVRDTLVDPLFADNPLVTGEPRIRFYAGYPLRLPDGTSPGSLCIIDVRPRDIDPTKLDVLKDLGKLVEIELNSPGKD